MQHNSLLKFVGKVLGWLVVMFAVWYYSSPLINLGLAAVLEPLLTGLFPSIFAEVNRSNDVLDIVTQFIWQQQTADGREGFLVFTVNPMLYGFGLPFFLALFLAVPEEKEVHPIKIVIGIFIILLTQMWGICFDSFKSLLFGFGPEIAAQVSTNSMVHNFVAYCYQLGTLILPVVTPVMLWLWFYNAYWREWVNVKD